MECQSSNCCNRPTASRRGNLHCFVSKAARISLLPRSFGINATRTAGSLSALNFAVNVKTHPPSYLISLYDKPRRILSPLAVVRSRDILCHVNHILFIDNMMIVLDDKQFS